MVAVRTASPYDLLQIKFAVNPPEFLKSKYSKAYFFIIAMIGLFIFSFHESVPNPASYFPKPVEFTEGIQNKNLPESESSLYPISGILPEGHSIHSSRICGTWQRDYRKLHNKIVAENKRNGKGKLLIFSSCVRGFECGGIGDHLFGMSTVFLLAIVFKRAFFIEWPELDATEVFQPATFDWRLKNINPSTKNVVRTNRFCDVPPNSSDSFELDFLNFDAKKKRLGLLADCIAKLENVSTIRVHLNRALTQWLLSQHNSIPLRKAMAATGLKSAFASGCLLRNLIKVSQKVKESVRKPLQELQSTNKLKICIHSRQRLKMDTEFTGQDIDIAQLMNETEVLLKCANTLYEYWGQESLGTLWFFMSSSKAARDRVKVLYPDRILDSGMAIMHSDLTTERQLALETTAAEWFLFTQCHFFVFHSSGMSKTAAAYAMRPLSMFSFGNFGWSKLRNKCNPSRSTTPLEMGSDWSGF